MTNKTLSPKEVHNAAISAVMRRNPLMTRSFAENTVAMYLAHVNEAYPDPPYTGDPFEAYLPDGVPHMAREAVYRIALNQFRDATEMVEKGQSHDE